MSRCLKAFCAATLMGGALGAPAPAPVAAPLVAPTTCGGMKEHYRKNECCGKPDKAVQVAPACPYNFNKPTCAKAEPQAPRDLSTGATGTKIPKAATLNIAQQALLPLANVHFHLGAEHKSDNYKDDTDAKAYDAKAAGGRRLAADPRPGFMCSKAGLSDAEKAPYTFQYCKGDVAVGKTYEVHYVHSSAGYTAEDIKDVDIDLLDDGLGGAANGRGQLNPMIVVKAQVFQIVNGAGAPKPADMLHDWTVPADDKDSVMYPGSTTGQSHDDATCSPYAITWFVSKKCWKISAESFDKMCKMKKEQYKMEADLYPHGSRIIVHSNWVTPASYVKPLA